jgi:hypothetical protein
METNYVTLTQCSLATEGVCINPIDIGRAYSHERKDPESLLFRRRDPYSDDSTGLPFAFAIDGIRPETDWQNETWVRSAANSTAFPPRSVVLVPARGASVICRISTEYVEASVDCLGLACRVGRVRASQRRHPHPNLVALEFSDLFRAFSAEFPRAVGTGNAAGKNPAEFFIDNPTNTLFNTTRKDVQVSRVEPGDIAVRLGQLVNTYYMSSLSPWTLMAAQMDDGGPQAGVSANFSAAANLVVNSDIYVCRWAWWGVFVGACLVMVATAGLAAALTYLCPGPDILGFVSTMARDSPHVCVAAGGSALDGADRARLLKGLRVQLQDVQSEEELGKLAFASLQGRPKPLRVDRLYV